MGLSISGRYVFFFPLLTTFITHFYCTGEGGEKCPTLTKHKMTKMLARKFKASSGAFLAKICELV
jgi:hypothetical protein